VQPSIHGIQILSISLDGKLKNNETLSFSTKFFTFVILFTIANAGQLYSFQERIIIFLVPLEYADAEQLADVLAPFLSPQGNIVAYSPTNTLIIKDQTSVEKNPIKVIKGKPDLSECQNFQHALRRRTNKFHLSECIKNMEWDEDETKRKDESEIWFGYFHESE